MFYHGASILTTLGRAGSLPSPIAPEGRLEWAEGEAARALQRVPGAMALSARLEKPAEYRRLQRERRTALEALLRAGAGDRTRGPMIDLIGAIVEESNWSENPDGARFDDEAHPEIDFQSAETAMLLAWVSRGVGAELDFRTQAKLVYEVRRRLFSPFLAHDDYPFMRGKGPRPLCILSDIVLCALILETDSARRGAIFKQALRQLDQAITWRDKRQEALADAAAQTGAVTDLALLLRMATGGELDATGECPQADWLDALLFPWIDGAAFVDPPAGCLFPAVSGAELFRVGLTAGDEALTALGGRLARLSRRPSATVTGRMMDMSCAEELSAQAGKPPRVKHAATAHNRVMVSRFSAFTCAMHAGGRANAGDIVLYHGSRPILVETPSGGSLPVIDRGAQLAVPDVPCDADFEIRPDREAMSIELTHAYDPAAYLRSYQRTAMIMRADGIVRKEGMLRLVEALDLTAPGRVTFQFLTPQTPEARDGGLRLGPVELSWEGELDCAFSPADETFPAGDPDGASLYRVLLSTPQPVSRAFYTFNFASA